MANKKTLLFAEERRRQIVELVNENQKLVIPELCVRFGVSASTVRNDLRDLQVAGLITRTHGGAIRNSGAGFDPLPCETGTPAEKAVARLAAGFVEDGDIIALSPGTITYELVRHLTHRRELTVIVNDLYFAVFLESNTDFTVVQLGGTLRHRFHYVQMPEESNYFDTVNIDKAFVMCGGLHPLRGATTPDPHLAYTLRRMIAASGEVYALFDSDSYGAVSFAQIAGLSAFHALLTDDGLGAEDAEALRARDCALFTAAAEE